jgi:UDP-glucose 4-epimerase
MGDIRDVMILGGTGFVGEYLTRFVAEDRNNRVCVVSNTMPSESERVPGAAYRHADLTVSDPALAELFEHVEVLVILTRPNAQIMENLLSILPTAPRLRKIVYASTLLLYPDSAERQDESCAIDPVSEYERGKADEERTLSSYARSRDLTIAIARLANVYGDVKNEGIIGRMFRSLFDGRALVLNGEGLQKRDYIFVEDVAEALKALIDNTQTAPVDVWNVCTGAGYSIRELGERIEAISGTKLEWTNGPPTPEKQSVIGNNAKITALIGRPARYPLDSGLRKAYENYLRFYSTGTEDSRVG